MPRWEKVPRQNWQRARAMRRTLRNGQTGVVFRRQHPIGPFIVDFLAPECRLVVEIDGDTHADPEQIAHDSERTRYLESAGFKIIRFTNRDVRESLASVIRQILCVVTPLNPPAEAGGHRKGLRIS